jgi:hypothetical protein
VLRARDLERESGYFLARDRQHAALAHVPGILRGLRLEVFERGTEKPRGSPDVRGDVALDLFLQAGVAVDGYGRLISVPRREQLGIELATSPSLLRDGTYRVSCSTTGPRAATVGPAAPPRVPARGWAPPRRGGGRTVRERYRCG